MAKDCVHKWNIDSKNVGTCSVCREVRQFPMAKGEKPVVLKAGKPPGIKHRRNRPSHDKIWERHEYFEKNKAAIIADLFALGNANTCAKWGIPNQTMVGLRNRWLTDEERAQIMARGPAKSFPTSSSPASSSNGRLPHFPEFSNTWEPSVQERWLDVYQALAAGADKGG